MVHWPWPRRDSWESCWLDFSCPWTWTTADWPRWNWCRRLCWRTHRSGARWRGTVCWSWCLECGTHARRATFSHTPPDGPWPGRLFWPAASRSRARWARPWTRSPSRCECPCPRRCGTLRFGRCPAGSSWPGLPMLLLLLIIFRIHITTSISSIFYDIIVYKVYTVVIRHWRAEPKIFMFSCLRSRSFSE